MTVKAVYVEQYGMFWRLTLCEWKALCEQGVKGEGHLLPSNRALKRRPSAAIGVENYGSGRLTYYPRTDTVWLYQPLDWEVEDYQNALAKIKEIQ